ncbi:MAG: Rv3235 family protein [Mycobacterium sp.]
MTSSTPSQTSPDPAPAQWLTTPIIDYAPAPAPLGRLPAPRCPAPSAEALHRRPSHPRRALPQLSEPPPPKSAVLFAETALRQVIEVIDRRRPVAQLRPVMTPVLVDRVIALARATHRGSATMRRVRVRAIDPGAALEVGAAVEAGVQKGDKHGEVYAAEVFASFSRCGRVHAVAARIERYRNRWRMVALQIG